MAEVCKVRLTSSVVKSPSSNWIKMLIIPALVEDRVNSNGRCARTVRSPACNCNVYTCRTTYLPIDFRAVRPIKIDRLSWQNWHLPKLNKQRRRNWQLN